MKRFKPLLLLTFVGVALISCNRDRNNPEARANELCECTKSLDFYKDSPSDAKQKFLRGNSNFDSEAVEPCVIKIWKNIDKDLSKLNEDGKVAYTKRFLKACIDTECSDKILHMVPYEMLGPGLEELENTILKRNERMEDYEEFEREQAIEELERLGDRR